MQAQVEPHFLFNTLANVQHLVETDAVAAAECWTASSTTCARRCRRCARGATSLGREVDMARAFLDIHRVRMGSRCST
jgi:LytS/YehU family sensor histidine kinase